MAVGVLYPSYVLWDGTRGVDSELVSDAVIASKAGETVGVIITFASIGLAVFTKAALTKKGVLGFVLLVLGLSTLVAHHVINTVFWGIFFQYGPVLLFRLAVTYLGVYLIGVGIGVIVFGGFLPREHAERPVTRRFPHAG